jgi:hypothetical protein
MTLMILIDTKCKLKQLNAKFLTDDTLYKKCGLKKADGFEMRAAWPIGLVNCKQLSSEKGSIEVWAKDKGKAGMENKYELPPPIDTNLYFSTMCVVARDQDGELCDIDIAKWEKMYSALFGGFEDLGNADSDEDDEDELEFVPDEKKTTEGYLKDGFVVDNKECLENDIEEYSSNNENDNDNDNDYGSELETEEYYYSDD